MKMARVFFLHPDLGFGGAERLVVDAALALRSEGYQITFMTPSFDVTRCFEELKEFKVEVWGTFIPRVLFGRFQVCFAVLRMSYIALIVLFKSLYESRETIVFCDQVSQMMPILAIGPFPIIFYCHYPDLLLCVKRNSTLRKIYRAVFDYLERKTTFMADLIFVNSNFTKEAFEQTFGNSFRTQLLYPAVAADELRKIKTNDYSNELKEILKGHENKKFIVLSINRFNPAKHLTLVLEAYAKFMRMLPAHQAKDSVLIMAGGYDPRLPSNVDYFVELCNLAEKLNMKEDTIFLRSFSERQKCALLQIADALIYSPENEHFGIVPIEAMGAGIPVLALDSGGPKESVVDNETGYLIPVDPDDDIVANRLAEKLLVLKGDEALKVKMGEAGVRRVASHFSVNPFGRELIRNCNEVLSKTRRRNAMRFRAIWVLFVSFIFMFGTTIWYLERN